MIGYWHEHHFRLHNPAALSIIVRTKAIIMAVKAFEAFTAYAQRCNALTLGFLDERVFLSS